VKGEGGKGEEEVWKAWEGNDFLPPPLLKPRSATDNTVVRETIKNVKHRIMKIRSLNAPRNEIKFDEVNIHTSDICGLNGIARDMNTTPIALPIVHITVYLCLFIDCALH